MSEFISFITSEASDRCHMEKRKTINGEDILFAMTNLGFDNYVDPLKLYLQKYREVCSNDLLFMVLLSFSCPQTTKGNDKSLTGGEGTIYEDIQGGTEEGFGKYFDYNILYAGMYLKSLIKLFYLDQLVSILSQLHVRI